VTLCEEDCVEEICLMKELTSSKFFTRWRFSTKLHSLCLQKVIIYTDQLKLCNTFLDAEVCSWKLLLYCWNLHCFAKEVHRFWTPLKQQTKFVKFKTSSTLIHEISAPVLWLWRLQRTFFFWLKLRRHCITKDLQQNVNRNFETKASSARTIFLFFATTKIILN
jgi:hypothetical protein